MRAPTSPTLASSLMRAGLRGLVALGLTAAACGGNSDESPVPPQPPSTAARLASQACACATLECLTPLQTQLASIIAAQHSSGNSAQDNAEATAKVKACAARLSAK
jgi:hypothetical protein